MKFLPLGILLLVGCATQPELGRLDSVRTWKTTEANQGVAVDAEHFYAIDDRALGKYEKATGRKVGEWRAPAGSPVKHLNSGVVVGGQLLVVKSVDQLVVHQHVLAARLVLQFFNLGDHLVVGGQKWQLPHCFLGSMQHVQYIRCKFVELS